MTYPLPSGMSGGDTVEWNFHWKPKHKHVWVWVGYGGAGWSAYECTECGEKEIT